jgi:hypothetical protein
MTGQILAFADFTGQITSANVLKILKITVKNVADSKCM